ncbi:hypothetical protein CEP54_002130 [Fusarium duplospermum]|uniref:Uncharacterized protein n=1 Tax=Fusarium duplospermum TaxID=1325734 RepID=A0A428QWL5_9HYPO|nr:hypothetical protein CEP54_002130 [Fusarium duplospermum]
MLSSPRHPSSPDGLWVASKIASWSGSAVFFFPTPKRQDVKLALPDRIEREGSVPIKIIKYHAEFRNVITDMYIIPQLWNDDKRVHEPDAKGGKKIHIDAMLHLGMNFADY